MKVSVLSVAALLALAGCGSGEPSEGAAPVTSTAANAALDPGVERAYLDQIRSGVLIGNYNDADLVALGTLFCDNLRDGKDLATGGDIPGDGTYVFDEVPVPVQVTDAVLSIQFAAVDNICPDVTID